MNIFAKYRNDGNRYFCYLFFVKYCSYTWLCMYLNCLCILLGSFTDSLTCSYYNILYVNATIGLGVHDDESDDELSTEAVVTISIVVTFIITLVVTALISVIITSMYYNYRYELKEKVKVDDDKNVNTKQKDSYGGNITMDTNPAYGTATTIKMDTNPYY